MTRLSASSRRGSSAPAAVGERQAAVRRAAELLADFAGLLAAAVAGAFQPGLDARRAPRARRRRRLRRAQILRRLPVGAFGGGQRIGGGLPLLLGFGQLAHQLLALLLDHAGQVAHGGDLALRLGQALL